MIVIMTVIYHLSSRPMLELSELVHHHLLLLRCLTSTPRLAEHCSARHSSVSDRHHDCIKHIIFCVTTTRQHLFNGHYPEQPGLAAIRMSPFWILLTHTHTHSILTAIFPGEPGLAGCPLSSPSPFIPGLRILLGQT